MSQRLWQVQDGDRRLEVLVGWDEPLRRYFLVVEDLTAPDDAPHSVAFPYSNLDDPHFDGSLLYVFGKLGEFGYLQPPGLFDALLVDRERADQTTRVEYGVAR